jgi:hypothetical protein
MWNVEQDKDALRTREDVVYEPEVCRCRPSRAMIFCRSMDLSLILHWVMDEFVRARDETPDAADIVLSFDELHFIESPTMEVVAQRQKPTGPPLTMSTFFGWRVIGGAT